MSILLEQMSHYVVYCRIMSY